MQAKKARHTRVCGAHCPLPVTVLMQNPRLDGGLSPPMPRDSKQSKQQHLQWITQWMSTALHNHSKTADFTDYNLLTELNRGSGSMF